LNVFEEFEQLAELLKCKNISYMLTGGVAMAFHGLPRFTRDIDFVISETSLPEVEKLLHRLGYKTFSKAWKLGESPLTLHRFLKPTQDEEWIIDVMTSADDLILEMIQRAQLTSDGKTEVRLACKDDLITLKSLRNSPQDKVDIENLRHEKA
jgi:predicted nucleotidyltransferase